MRRWADEIAPQSKQKKAVCGFALVHGASMVLGSVVGTWPRVSEHPPSNSLVDDLLPLLPLLSPSTHPLLLDMVLSSACVCRQDRLPDAPDASGRNPGEVADLFHGSVLEFFKQCYNTGGHRAFGVVRSAVASRLQDVDIPTTITRGTRPSPRTQLEYMPT